MKLALNSSTNQTCCKTFGQFYYLINIYLPFELDMLLIAINQNKHAEQIVSLFYSGQSDFSVYLHVLCFIYNFMYYSFNFNSLQYFISNYNQMGQVCQSTPIDNHEFTEDKNIIKFDSPTPDFATKIHTKPQLPMKIKQRIEELGPFFKYVNLNQQKQAELMQKTYKLKNGSIYCGTWFKGMMHGKGKLYLVDGAYFEGTFSNNQIVGMGRIIHLQGDYYEGNFERSLANGKGKYISEDSTYEGEFKNNVPHGHGKETTAHFVFEGEYWIGQKTHGELRWPINATDEKHARQEASFFKGNFFQNKFHGKGVLQNKYGVYDGNFQKGQKSGEGKMTYPDGTFYVGTFAKDFRNGYGELFDQKNYLIEKGIWKRDSLTKP